MPWGTRKIFTPCFHTLDKEIGHCRKVYELGQPRGGDLRAQATRGAILRVGR